MHTIRLRGPWLRRTQGGDDWERIKLPEAGSGSGLEDPERPLQYRRQFNCPTGLEEGTCVELWIESASGRLLRVELNGMEMPFREAAFRHDITTHLRPHNTLELTVVSSDQQVARIGEVALQVIEAEPSGRKSAD